MSNTDKIKKIKPKIVKKAWGYEEHVVNDIDNGYCGKLLVFEKAGGCCSLHFHAKKHEVFRILSGAFLLTCVDTLTAEKFEISLNVGDAIVIPRNQPHQILCLIEGTILEFSTPDDPIDSYRVAKGDGQK